jgi:hypothetical protein
VNARLVAGTLHQPEPVDAAFDKDDTVSWSLFVPSAVLKADKAKKPPKILLTLLLGRSSDEVGYGLRVFFERAGTGALLCLSGREGGDKGGRWNQGIGQTTIEKLIARVGLKGVPEIRVLAGYSTGYGVVQTINNGSSYRPNPGSGSQAGTDEGGEVRTAPSFAVSVVAQCP